MFASIIGSTYNPVYEFLRDVAVPPKLLLLHSFFTHTPTFRASIVMDWSLTREIEVVERFYSIFRRVCFRNI
nr:MAG TPA: hypothetical protein [Bacteriophage sp.]